MGIKFTRNPTIRKKDYKKELTTFDKKTKSNITTIDYHKDEYIFDKKTNIVPKKTNKLICIILSEDKGAYFILRKRNINKELDYFHFKKGMYIIDNDSIHITSNNCRLAVYFEGISTALKFNNIEKEIKTTEYIDLLGKKQTSIIQKIKGLKFDAKILDIFANRRFAEIFTKSPMKNFEFYLLIIGLVTIIMVGIGYGVSYVFR